MRGCATEKRHARQGSAVTANSRKAWGSAQGAAPAADRWSRRQAGLEASLARALRRKGSRARQAHIICQPKTCSLPTGRGSLDCRGQKAPRVAYSRHPFLCPPTTCMFDSGGTPARANRPPKSVVPRNARCGCVSLAAAAAAFAIGKEAAACAGAAAAPDAAGGPRAKPSLLLWDCRAVLAAVPPILAPWPRPSSLTAIASSRQGPRDGGWPWRAVEATKELQASTPVSCTSTCGRTQQSRQRRSGGAAGEAMQCRPGWPKAWCSVLCEAQARSACCKLRCCPEAVGNVNATHTHERRQCCDVPRRTCPGSLTCCAIS